MPKNKFSKIRLLVLTNGIAVIGLPVENSLADLLDFNSYYSGHKRHLYSFSLKNIRVLLGKCNFCISDKPVVEPWPAGKLRKFRLVSLVTRLVQYLPPSLAVFFSNGNWLIAKKCEH